MPEFARPVLATLASFALTWLALHLLLRSRVGRRLADEPNARSLHRTVTPRIGGLGMLCGLAGAVAWVGVESPWAAAVATGYVALALFSLLDDAHGLSPLLRLVAHLAVAAGFVTSLPLQSAASIPMVIALAWAINLYNFMDGSDGLAGGMTLVGFGTYAILFAVQGHAPWAGICASIGASAAAFLLFNFSPAKLFLGDNGSVPLGFCAGAIGVSGFMQGAWTAWTPFIVFFPFFFDATFTLLRRALAGKRIWQAHREHVYQRAILSGLSHRRLAMRAYLLMITCSVLGFVSTRVAHEVAGLIIAFQTLSGLAIAWRVDRNSKPRTPLA